MQIVDTALRQAEVAGHPVRVVLVGAGYSARIVARHIVQDVPGMRLVAIGNRTPEHALSVLGVAGIRDALAVGNGGALETALAKGRVVATEDVASLCASDFVDVVVDLTGTVDFGAETALDAIHNGKHVVSMNVELDSTVGPFLAHLARKRGVVYTNIDGDEPGVAQNLIRTVRGLGLEPVMAGNLKGLYDRYRTPATQARFARERGQKATTMTHFADGTKLFMELTVLANATGFPVAKRGCYGPELPTVQDTVRYYSDKLLDGGMVDFTVGAAPANGVFVLARTSDEPKAEYLEYFKMGSGPLYCFYTPFHLPHLEISSTIARAALLNDPTVSPMGAPVCDTVTTAKRDLEVGEVLDGIGGYCAYGLIDNFGVSRSDDMLPMGVSHGCRLRRRVPKDTVLTYDDVDLPPGRTIDRLRQEQKSVFQEPEV